MNKLVILIVVLIICAGVIYAQQNEAPAPPTEPAAVTLQTEAESAPSVVSELISSAPDNARLFISNINDGDTLTSPITVRFGLENMAVSPAGVEAHHAGHHHLLINYSELPDLSQPLPATDTLIHFGGGQTETSVDLDPGTYTLQLVLGNHLHIPHNPPVISEKITVTIIESATDTAPE